MTFNSFPIPTKPGFEALLLQKSGEVAGYADSADADADRATGQAGIATTQAAAALVSAAEADAFATQAELAALAAGAPIVMALADPEPADGTVVLLKLDAGLQVHEVVTGAWVLRGWLVGPKFDTVPLMLASTATTLGPVGQIVEAENSRFQIVSSGGDETTNGNVSLLHVSGDLHRDRSVTVPTHYPDFQTAIESEGRFRPGKFKIIISCLNSFRPMAGAALVGGDYSHMTVTTGATTIEVHDDYTDTDDNHFWSFDNCRAPDLDIRIDMALKGGDGLSLLNNSICNVLSAKGVVRAGGNGAVVASGSRLNARNTRWHDAAGRAGVQLSRGWAQVSDSDVSGCRLGLTAEDGSWASARGINAQNCSGRGISAYGGSWVQAQGSDSSNCQVGLWCSQGSWMDARNATANNCTPIDDPESNFQGAVCSRRGSRINFSLGTAQNTNGLAFFVHWGGEIITYGGSITGSERTANVVVGNAMTDAGYVGPSIGGSNAVDGAQRSTADNTNGYQIPTSNAGMSGTAYLLLGKIGASTDDMPLNGYIAARHDYRNFYTMMVSAAPRSTVPQATCVIMTSGESDVNQDKLTRAQSVLVDYNGDRYVAIKFTGNNRVPSFGLFYGRVSPSRRAELRFIEASEGSNETIITGNNQRIVVAGHVFLADGLRGEGVVDLPNLPTSDPGVSGRLWRDGSELKISTT